MEYPITQVKTSDDVWLYGLFIPAENSKILFLHTHGTASNFYEEYFVEVLAKDLNKNGISLLSVNNRGAGAYDPWQKIGAAVEKFEDCLTDLDAWVEFALAKGFEKIILSGHSLGTEKVVYYLDRGKYKNNINSIVLLAPANSPGSEPELIGEERLSVLLEQSRVLVDQGKGDTFLYRDAYAGTMPKSAESFLNFVAPESEIQKALPFHTGILEMYGRINVPILAVIGDQEEYTVIPIKDALDLMVKENPKTKAHQIENCDHDFQEKEEELSKIVLDFISKN
jgi:pimeloyl-ACP methyl ester carboxylesterase